jgi:hypothetical protein
MDRYETCARRLGGAGAALRACVRAAEPHIAELLGVDDHRQHLSDHPARARWSITVQNNNASDAC